jgi:hypothetical protein
MLMLCLALILGATAAPQVEPTAAPRTAQESATPPTILVDLVVTDAKGGAITNLRPGELEVFQEGRVQRVDALKPNGPPGRYELTYTPVSGKVAGVTVRALRPGAHIAGPDGPFLKPRVIPGLSPFEAQLAELLDAQPDADDFPCQTAVLRFEARPDGVHHTLVVDVALAALRITRDQGRYRGQLQMFARLKDASGRPLHYFSLDQPLEVASAGEVRVRHFVWTGDVHLLPGHYTLETLVVDSETSHKTARAVSFEAPAVGGGLRMSSVTLLQLSTALLVRREGDDDPLFFGDAPLMPTFGLVLPVETDATVRFFVTLYPDPKATEPPSLKLEVLRDGSPVGAIPIPLPLPDAHGRISYVGDMPTRTFRVARYTLRLVARQGASEVTEEASVTIAPRAPSTPLPMVNPD